MALLKNHMLGQLLLGRGGRFLIGGTREGQFGSNGNAFGKIGISASMTVT